MKNLANKALLRRLKNLYACEESVVWIGTRDLKTAWEECPNIVWLLWFAGRSKKLPVQKLVIVACAFARTSLKYVPEGELRPLHAIEAAERWTEGKASLSEVSAAGDAAWAAGDAARAAARAARDAARDAALAALAARAARAAGDTSNRECLNRLKEIFSYADL